MRIGELARSTGVSTMTIRYYEDIGLLPEPARAANGYREYEQDATERLRFIREAQETGLTLAEVGSILELRRQGEPTCDHVVELLERHLEEVELKIKALRESRATYTALIERAKGLESSHCTDPIRCQTITSMGHEHAAEPAVAAG